MRLHPEDIQEIAKQVVFLMANPPKEQRFESDFGKRVLAAKAELARKKAVRSMDRGAA